MTAICRPQHVTPTRLGIIRVPTMDDRLHHIYFRKFSNILQKNGQNMQYINHKEN